MAKNRSKPTSWIKKKAFKELSRIISSRGMVSTTGRMEVIIMVVGKMVIDMALASLKKPMELPSKDNGYMTKVMVLAYKSWKMAVFIKDIGKMISLKDLDSFKSIMVKSSKANSEIHDLLVKKEDSLIKKALRLKISGEKTNTFIGLI